MKLMIEHYSGQSEQIAEIFHTAIHAIADEHYNARERTAWAGEPTAGSINYEHWQWRCELKRPFVYIEAGTVHGFLELDPDGHIDCHYVHPNFARRGIGGQLLQHAIRVAERNRLSSLSVEASHLAKGLYLKHGFDVIGANQVERSGVTIANWKMIWHLSK